MDLYLDDTNTAYIILKGHADKLRSEFEDVARLLHPEPSEDSNTESQDYEKLQERWLRLSRQETVAREYVKTILAMRSLLKDSQVCSSRSMENAKIRISHEDLYRMGLLSDEGAGQATVDALYGPLRERRGRRGESLLTQEMLDALSQFHVYGSEDKES